MKLQGSYAYDKTGNRTASKRLVTTQGSDCTDAPPGGPCTPTGLVSQLTERTYSYASANHSVITIGNTERRYDAAGNPVWIGPSLIDVMPPNDPESRRRTARWRARRIAARSSRRSRSMTIEAGVHRAICQLERFTFYSGSLGTMKPTRGGLHRSGVS
jgi:hypothetical protein